MRKGYKMIGSAETDLGTATHGLTPGDLDLLTRFHPLNERSLLENSSNKFKEEKETKEKPTRGKADEPKMEGVGDAKTDVKRGRGRGRARIYCNDNESFIATEIKNLGHSSFGSTCGSSRNEVSEDSFTAIAVNDLSRAMQGVSLNENEVKPKKNKSRGRRIQNK